MSEKKILFGCTGNSCRSVMAQGLLQKCLKQLETRLKDPVEVASAGVFAIDGMSPSKETLRLLQEEGVDMTAHMARNLTPEMIRESTWIVVMEPFQRDEILLRAPDARDKVCLLRRFGLPEGASVAEAAIPDPIGRPRDVYESCFALIKDGVERVAQALISEAE